MEAAFGDRIGLRTIRAERRNFFPDCSAGAYRLGENLTNCRHGGRWRRSGQAVRGRLASEISGVVLLPDAPPALRFYTASPE